MAETEDRSKSAKAADKTYRVSTPVWPEEVLRSPDGSFPDVPPSGVTLNETQLKAAQAAAETVGLKLTVSETGKADA